jgi:hypothetical protein
MTVPEQRKEGYITLKEASERFGYSQDYLGQLIRKGKIDGKLVYSHVAWVTTPEAIEQYIDDDKNKKGRGRKKRGGSDEPLLSGGDALPTEIRIEEKQVQSETETPQQQSLYQNAHSPRMPKSKIDLLLRAILFFLVCIAVAIAFLIIDILRTDKVDVAHGESVAVIIPSHYGAR